VTFDEFRHVDTSADAGAQSIGRGGHRGADHRMDDRRSIRFNVAPGILERMRPTGAANRDLHERLRPLKNCLASDRNGRWARVPCGGPLDSRTARRTKFPLGRATTG
jgi:hypothetical protein